MVLSPGGWLDLLGPRLDAQAAEAQFYREYHDGTQKLTFATAKFRQAFAQFFTPMAYNWMELVVAAAVERLEVQGFRFDPDPSKPSWDQRSDAEAWAIWQANGLDAQSVMAHTEAVKCGTSFALVSPPVEGREPRITIESPLQMYVQSAEGDPRNRLAALKRFAGADGHVYATLYLPGYIYKFRSKTKPTGVGRIEWVPRNDDAGGKNPLRVVPVVPLENTPDLLDGGRSDLKPAYPFQDAINKLCLDMMVSSAYHSDPQLTATGWEVPKDPATGEVLASAAIKVGTGSLLASESPDTRFGQLLPGDVDNYLKPIDGFLDQLAAVTRTPAYYIKGKMANMSAEALKAAETGLVYRCKRKTLSFGEGWEEVMRLAFKAKGDTRRSMAVAAETVWADPESRSLAQVVDAAVKLRESLDVPAEVAWQISGFSPQQIQQMIAMNGWTPGGPATGPNASSNGAGDPARIELPVGVDR